MADTYKKIYITAPFTVETKDVPIPEAGLPYAYVRWTSELNVKHSLDMIASGKIKANAFKPTMFSPDQIVEAYEMIRNRDPKLGMQAMIKWQ